MCPQLRILLKRRRLRIIHLVKIVLYPIPVISGKVKTTEQQNSYSSHKLNDNTLSRKQKINFTFLEM
jgi:hypothetical protein